MEIEARSNVLQLKQRARLRRRLMSEDLYQTHAHGGIHCVCFGKLCSGRYVDS